MLLRLPLSVSGGDGAERVERVLHTSHTVGKARPEWPRVAPARRVVRRLSGSGSKHRRSDISSSRERDHTRRAVRRNGLMAVRGGSDSGNEGIGSEHRRSDGEHRRSDSGSWVSTDL